MEAPEACAEQSEHAPAQAGTMNSTAPNFMPPEVILFVRIIAASGFIITLLGAIFIVKNQKRIFTNPEMPSDRSGSRLYAKFLVYAALAHALVLFGSFALLLH